MTWVGLVKDANADLIKKVGKPGFDKRKADLYNNLRQKYGSKNKQVLCVIDRGEGALTCAVQKVRGEFDAACRKQVTDEYFACVGSESNQSSRS